MPNLSPIQSPEADARAAPEHGMALCLSGGGYRAMLFHVGALWRLHETGVLRQLARISSVSGGSITAGVLALAWPALLAETPPQTTVFKRDVVEPIRALARVTIDAHAVIWGLALPGSISDRVAAAYDEHLFHGKTLQDLPDTPRFVINATNVQSGALWRFSKPYMRDYRVGEVEHPTVTLAQAVAASSAFPPVLSPFTLDLDPAAFTPATGADLQCEPYTSRVVLTDGGVYDNLGLETAWKRYDTILVSDGGGKMQPEPEPKTDWAQHAYRVLNLIDNQVRSLRQRLLIASYQAPAGDADHRAGAYWGIRTDIANYQLPDALPCPHDRTMALADTPTRLATLDEPVQQQLINWGYAVCDAGLRKHVDQGLPPPAQFPYPCASV